MFVKQGIKKLMKQTVFMGLAISSLLVIACNTRKPEARFLDLNSGEYVQLKKDSASNRMVNAQTGEPVELYVDESSNDTIWGASGKVVNGRLNREDDGTWIYIDDQGQLNSGDNSHAAKSSKGEEYKIKHGDYKKEVEKDGDITIKTGHKKIKIDGETGKRKVKKD